MSEAGISELAYTWFKNDVGILGFTGTHTESFSEAGKHGRNVSKEASQP